MQAEVERTVDQAAAQSITVIVQLNFYRYSTWIYIL